jgi:altronate dehydratase
VDRDYQFEVDARDPAAPEIPATFQGYRRANGKFGTRNYLGILTSVNCSATVARFIAREVERSGLLDDYPEVDGVIPLVHGHGCGMASKGEGYEVLKRTQWGYAANPNMGAVLMVGLGCETFQIARWKQAYNIAESDTFRSLTIQDSGGTQKAIDAGIAAVREMLPGASKVRRETAPASELMLALQCGGSDGYSGITANPALGAAAKGGTTRLKAVMEYAEPVTAKGFVFMDTPGYDPVSATGQVAGGANILCFTTGRGSAYGCKPTPSIKLATNTLVYERMIDDMDINCGDVLDGVSIADKGEEIFRHILKIASGERSKSEKLGYGDAEFVPWQIGATM